MLAVEQTRRGMFRGAVTDAERDLSPSEQRIAMGKALRNLRKRVRPEPDVMSQEEAAAAAEVTRQAWQNYETGKRQVILRSDVQERLVRALGMTIDDLHGEYRAITGQAAPPAPQAGIEPPEMIMLPVRDRIQAGAWLAIDGLDQRRVQKIPVLRDPRYPQADQWIAPVIGDSMNRLNIQEGDMVHCVSTIDIHYFPRTGDVVEVERIRFGGQERELTLKQVEVTAEGVLLWPRSTNPRWQEPIEIRPDGAEEEIEVRIRGLVLTSMRRHFS